MDVNLLISAMVPGVSAYGSDAAKKLGKADDKPRFPADCKHRPVRGVVPGGDVKREVSVSSLAHEGARSQ